jgi:hypothetical protein
MEPNAIRPIEEQVIETLAIPQLPTIPETEKIIQGTPLGYEWKSYSDDNNPFDGYSWRDEGWVPGMISLDTWFMNTPNVQTGAMVFYAPGVMEATAAYRGLDLKGYIGGVSGMFPSDIGKSIWINVPGYGWSGPFLVVDCARRNDLYGIVEFRGEVVEISWFQAYQWGMVTGKYDGDVIQWKMNGVEISKVPPDQIVDAPVSLKDWFVDLPTYVPHYSSQPVYEGGCKWWIGKQITDFCGATP